MHKGGVGLRWGHYEFGDSRGPPERESFKRMVGNVGSSFQITAIFSMSIDVFIFALLFVHPGEVSNFPSAGFLYS